MLVIKTDLFWFPVNGWQLVTENIYLISNNSTLNQDIVLKFSAKINANEVANRMDTR